MGMMARPSTITRRAEAILEESRRSDPPSPRAARGGRSIATLQPPHYEEGEVCTVEA